MSHNFIDSVVIKIKNMEYFICTKCSLIVYKSKDPMNSGFVISSQNKGTFEVFRAAHITCEEVIIKYIIE